MYININSGQRIGLRLIYDNCLKNGKARKVNDMVDVATRVALMVCTEGTVKRTRIGK
jgi:hypothetical protein